MAKYIIMAEEGERPLIDKAREELGLDLRDAEVLFTGVGAINIIRSLHISTAMRSCTISVMPVVRTLIWAVG